MGLNSIPFLINLPNFSYGDLITHLGLLGPLSEPRNNPKYPNLATLFYALFWMVKIMLWRPKFIPIPIPLHMSMSPIPRDLESHILSHWGPHECPETTQNTLDTVALFLALFQMVKIKLRWPQLIPVPTPFMILSPIQKGLRITHFRPLWSQSESKNNPKCPQHRYIFDSRAVENIVLYGVFWIVSKL